MDDDQTATVPNPDRRAALRYVAALFGGALVGGPGLLRALEAHPADGGATTDPMVDEYTALLDTIADTILPATATPGASDAGVGPFIALMVAESYDPDERETFRTGLHGFRDRCEANHGAAFQALDPATRKRLLEALDAEQHGYMEDKEDDDPTHWFRMLKELTLLGFFTSEIGYTQVMRYEETPGRFDPCVPLEDGGKAWASHA